MVNATLGGSRSEKYVYVVMDRDDCATRAVRARLVTFSFSSSLEGSFAHTTPVVAVVDVATWVSLVVVRNSDTVPVSGPPT